MGLLAWIPVLRAREQMGLALTLMGALGSERGEFLKELAARCELAGTEEAMLAYLVDRAEHMAQFGGK